MARNFKLPSMPQGRKLPFGSISSAAAPLAVLKDPQILVRILLGLLLAANLVAASFAFHLFEVSPEQIARQVQSTRQQIVAQMLKLNATRMHASKVDKGRDEGSKFVTTYMTQRRSAYSDILSDIDAMAAASSMKSKDATIGFEAIEGTDSLDMMTITANFESNYPGLLKFLNQVDRSKRFFIIENVAAAPQSNQNGILLITIKLNTFVKEDPGA